MRRGEALWQLEEEFWTGGEPLYRQRLSPDCVMVFPKPAGILKGEAILEALKGAPRWKSVRMTSKQLVEHDAGTVVLAYEARAERDEKDFYSALCSSTYARAGGAWRLLQHQQTPVA